MVWLVVANSNNCRIYYCQNNLHDLQFVQEMNHSKSRLKNADLVTDKPGHYKVDTGNRGAFAEHEEPKEIEMETFAREIAEELNKERRIHSERKFILAALPHMSGLICASLEKHSKENLTHTILKDYNHLSERELLETLKKDILLDI